jgi:hypothetical protein
MGNASVVMPVANYCLLEKIPFGYVNDEVQRHELKMTVFEQVIGCAHSGC